tara:strand:- start:5280 stop:5984 length:705 start_codon:yes stop_codon:yes gene_type:complete
VSEFVEKLTENQAVVDVDFPIEFKSYSGGTQQVPSAAAITVKDSGGTVLVDGVAMAIDGNGTMTYSLLAANLTETEENLVIEIDYTVSSVVYKAIKYFDTVVVRLKCNVIDTDLKAYYPTLAAQIWSVQSPANYDVQIQEAKRYITRQIENKYKRAYRINDGSPIREVVIFKTFEMIFYAFSKSPDDIWWFRYQEEKERFEKEFTNLVIAYDEDEDKLIDDEEKETLGKIAFGR